MPTPTIGRIVVYRTDGRNGLSYDLPAVICCTKDTHPGDYVQHEDTCDSLFDAENMQRHECNCDPTIKDNPLPVPRDEEHVHLTVFTPGGFGTTVDDPEHEAAFIERPRSDQFVGATGLRPGSGSYVELNVPYNASPHKRTWRWPTIS